MDQDKYKQIEEENQILKSELSKAQFEKEMAEKDKERLLNELVETRNSKTYKLARGLTCIPRKLRGMRYTHRGTGENQTVYPYMFSVVIAVYNTADFLEEMLDSVLQQKKNILSTYLISNGESMFKQNVYENIFELILVDDGSTDGTEKICDTYAEKYDQIKVIHKENGGVSSARNAGIEVAQGKYITFPDSDDKLSKNVFEECFLFFEAHEREICMVTYPLRFFDGQTGDHWTTYRFSKGSRVLDMQNEWDKPQFFTAATFFKTAFIQENHIQFDCSLINGEDITFAHEIMYRDKAFVGLVGNCTYWYRRRSTGELSAIQKSKNTENYYIPYLTDMLGGLMNKAKDTYGYVPKFVQYAVMGQLQWRIRSDGDGSIAREVISEEEYQEYRFLIHKLVKEMDLDVILSQKQLFREHMFYLCKIKTDCGVERRFENDNISYYFEDRFCSDAASCYVRLEFMHIKSGKLVIEGTMAELEPADEIWIKIGETKIPVERDFTRNADVKILDETALFTTAFTVSTPLTDVMLEDICFGSTISGYDVIKDRVLLGKFMPLTKNFSNSYYANEDWVVRLEGNRLVITKLTSADMRLDFEHEFEKQLLNSKHGRREDVKNALSVRREALNKKIFHSDEQISDRQIWIISDRYSVADDNGEAFFEYMQSIHDPDIDFYFVIDRDSPDYKRFAATGRVVAQDSREHHVLHLIADCIISSQADEYIINPVWRSPVLGDIYRDFYCRSKFVFLQHGVIKDDLSGWLNRLNKNIDGFVCAAIPEAESIHNCDYYYDKQVWLTGLPRYDRLYHDEKKYILVMPTWRKWLMKDFNAAKSDKDAVHVMDHIEHTEFFEFYSSLLNNKRLLDVCDKYGYKLCYMPHTNFRECMGKFCKDKRIVQFDLNMPYRKAFAEANLLITDYSSTPMDFAYLRKPVIYAQFDREKFFSGEHTYEKGYFDYERDGFGEVVYDLDSLIDLIISYIENGCLLKETYRQRIDGFFAYDDKNNCARVYNKIIEMMKDGVEK